MKRRTLISGLGSLAFVQYGNADHKAEYRVAVIGDTKRGGYGHGLDTMWLNLPETIIVGVADPDAAGLSKAMKTLGTTNGFADYRKMLGEVKADLVAVCPRQPDQHAEMILAAIEAGAKGLYVEKPFVRTLQEVDEIKAALEKSGARVAVAHRNRYHPDLKLIDQILLNEGDMKIGRLLEIRGRGKSDRRGGSEDLWVLGTHVLDLTSRFGGVPRNCCASILQDGKPITASDIHPGAEALGPLAGNEVHARFEMENGVSAYWSSIANEGTKNLSFGLQLIGSEGVVIIHCDGKPFAHYRRGNPMDPGNRNLWEVIGNVDQENIKTVHNHVLPGRDLIDAVVHQREPVCGFREAATTVEMVMSVFASHFSEGRKISLPLMDREHPLIKASIS